MKYFLPVILYIFSATGVLAQFEVRTHLDMGKNNVSDGAFLKNAFHGSFAFSRYRVEAGMQFDYISSNPNTLSGFDIAGTGTFSIRNFPFDVKGLFILNRFSDLMFETNWGFRGGTSALQHFRFELGTFFRTYTISAESREEYLIDRSDSRLRENFNLMYLAAGYLKPQDHPWNIGLAITNADYYLLNQSTNPMVNIKTKYSIKPGLSVSLDYWLHQAGVFNISAHRFGYLIRGGMVWEI